MTDAVRDVDPVAQIAGLTHGDALIFRHYELEQTERQVLGKKLARACRERHVSFLVAGDPGLALALRANGVHLPGWLLKKGLGWHRRPVAGWHVTAAAHSFSDLTRAARSGVDACLLSPVFKTASHPKAQILGPLRFARLAAEARLPVYALGGITRTTARRLKNAGATGFAGVSLI